VNTVSTADENRSIRKGDVMEQQQEKKLEATTSGDRQAFVALARIAWESAQEKDRQLREIERLLEVGKDSEALAAMRSFFKLAPD
jgi:hypothetical protein